MKMKKKMKRKKSSDFLTLNEAVDLSCGSKMLIYLWYYLSSVDKGLFQAGKLIIPI